MSDSEAHPGFLESIEAWSRTIGFAALALVLGVIGFGFLFSDAPSIWINVGEAAVFFFLSGLAIGYLHPERWWIAGLTAWMGFLVVGMEARNAYRFRNAPVVEVAVAEGRLTISPIVVPAGETLRIRETNQGATRHHLGTEVRGWTSRPLSPGETFAYRRSYPPGRYLIICLEETSTGVPHRDLGEVAEFMAE